MTEPRAIYCRGCDYALVGLVASQCPECGRAFDPDDARTFTRTPRRRRWLRRIGVVAAIAAIVFVLAPRRIAYAELKITCTRCRTEYVGQRWEPQPATWLPIRYPGYTDVVSAWPTTWSSTQPACRHHLRAALKLKGGASGWSAAGPGRIPTINGIPAYPDSAARILRNATDPDGPGGGLAFASTRDKRTSTAAPDGESSGK